jgi:general nucleoside transport system permease protein
MRRYLDRIELRPREISTLFEKIAPILAIFLTCFFILIAFLLTGLNLEKVWLSFFKNTIGSWRGFTEAITIFIPLCICSIGVAIAKKSGFWNIGGDGQILLGGLAGVIIALNWGENLSFVGNFIAYSTSFIFGGSICYIITYFKLYRKADEVLLTILSNYIVLSFVRFLLNGVLLDPLTHYPASVTIPIRFQITRIAGLGRVGFSFVPLILVVILFIFFEKRTLWNKAILQVGKNFLSATLLGLNPRKLLFIATFISGGLCGLAGWIQVSGFQHNFIDNLLPSYGYYAVLIMVLGGSELTTTILYAFIFSILINGISGVCFDLGADSYINDFMFGSIFIIFSILTKLGNNQIVLRRS